MATIAEKSRTKEIIDRLQGIIDGASAVPLAPGKISVYKEEIQNLLTELSTQMDNELKTYHEVNDRRGKLISEAKKEAEKIIYQAEHSASRMRVSRHTTDVAPLDFESLDEEELSALGSANEIYGASLIYTDEMLTEVSEMISTAYQNIRSDYEIILQVFEEKLATIISNRQELMAGLQEMDDADRSQQILEIGQLLSSELHMSRMKAKMNSDENADGSVQLTLNLQLEQEEEKARLAEEKAQQTAEALAEMTAERDALAATVEKLQKGSEEKAVDNIKEAAAKNVDSPDEPDEEYEVVYVTEDELEEGEEYEIEYVDDDESEEDEEYEVEYVDDDESEEDVEYEIVYVTEDELEEGEEYEIEYVDEEDEITEKAEMAVDKEQGAKEPAKRNTAQTFFVKAEDKREQEKLGDKKSEDKNVKRDQPKEEKSEDKNVKRDQPEQEKSGNDKMPVIPRFKKSESVASVPSERIAKMATVITTDKKYSGLIGGAVKTSADSGKDSSGEDTSASESKPEKDEDIKTDKNGKEYVEAKMDFSEDYEIMEF